MKRQKAKIRQPLKEMITTKLLCSHWLPDSHKQFNKGKLNEKLLLKRINLLLRFLKIVKMKRMMIDLLANNSRYLQVKFY